MLAKRINPEPPLKRRFASPTEGLLEEEKRRFWYTIYERIKVEPRQSILDQIEKKFSAMKKLTSHADDSRHNLLELMRKGEIVPRIEHVNNSLLDLARNGNHALVKDIIQRLDSEFHLKGTNETAEAYALALFNGGDMETSLKILEKLDKWGQMHRYLFHRSIKEQMPVNTKQALELFAKLKKHVDPLPETLALVVKYWAIEERTEMALKEYRECTALGTPQHPDTHAALIYACAKRRSFYPQVIEYLHQMQLYAMPITLRTYNNILMSCAKAADLRTAMLLWKMMSEKKEFQPNSISLSHLFWTLAAMETPENRLSIKRRFAYELSSEQILKVFEELQRQVDKFRFKPDQFLLTAQVAALANHNFKERAEGVFWNEHDRNLVDRNLMSYEAMLRMYDTLKEWEAMLLVRLDANNSKVALSQQAYRSIIRCAALTDHLAEAMDFLEEARKLHRFKPNELRALHLRIYEHQRFDLHERLKKLVDWPVDSHPNPMAVWRNRAEKIKVLMDKVYGKEAPAIARWR